MNKSITQNVDVIRRVNVGSDHRLVRAKIKLNTRLGRIKMPKWAIVNIEVLSQKETEFQLKLQITWGNLKNEEVEEMALNIRSTI